MQLNLKNPIIFFDLETTGVDPAKDRIVEISMVKVMPDGAREVKTRRINPETPIPAAAAAIHHITDDDVRDCPKFREIARSLAQYIEGCDLGGFNSIKFDMPLLAEEFLRAGVDVDLKRHRMIDVQNIFHKMEQRTLVAAYKFYCNKTLDEAHSAEADTLATYEVLLAQLDRYPDDLKNDVDFLADFSTHSQFADYAGRIVYDDKRVERFNFGKHKGRSVAEVFRTEPSYYSWIMDGDFPQYTKKVVTEIRLREAALNLSGGAAAKK
ncbi:MAG: 3'-5' exonuclease [Rikenellaceae bacterium]|jgi:DNA polymerase-3 subunit epsilon|nr:3'-5' exonuclease [Rikenellaceae bacterium]